jgi:hypothetical protein
MSDDDQPFIDRWPIWNEPLSKVTAPFDVVAARQRLARHFNVRRPPLAGGGAVGHHRGRDHSPRRKA